jgi:hypothetical protein
MYHRLEKTMGRGQMKNVVYAGAVAAVMLLGGCSPEVGSKAWCEAMDKKPKGDWTANEAADYAQHCVFRSEK